MQLKFNRQTAFAIERGPVIGSPCDLLPRGCRCAMHRRRLFSAALLGAGLTGAMPSFGREGVEVGRQSRFAQLVPASQIEEAASGQYLQLQQQAAQKDALAPGNDPQVRRLRAIAQRLIPYTYDWNERARQWNWEVSLFRSPQVNAFCMPGGKIAFFSGILQSLQLSDDEVAMIMGHEMAHALREHARERMGKSAATNIGANLMSSLLGFGNVGNTVLGMGSQLLSLTWSRDDESEADSVGLELAARAGYDPRAGITLWKKMGAASKGRQPEWLSTHPAGSTRIRDIESNLPNVEPLFDRAARPPQRFEPPAPRTGRNAE